MSLRVSIGLFLGFGFCVGSIAAAEIDPIKIALLVDGMASRGSSFDAAELHGLGTEGLAAVLDHLLPDTTPLPPPRQPGPPAGEIRALITRLDADDFKTREAATQTLIDTARGQRALIEDALRHDSLEIRLRAERVLASWEPRHAERLAAYLSGFWTYLEGINDGPRLNLLARRTMKAFEAGMPEGDRLHLLRLCIAGVAHGRDDASCNVLLPLVRHADARVALLAAETVGAYKADPRFLPELMLAALASERAAVVEAALRFAVGAQDERRRANLHVALVAIFDRGDEGLKFQACLPLVRDFHDSRAWIYVLEQTASSDANRVRTALNWIGDTKNCGQAPDAVLSKRLAQLLAAAPADQRRVAAQALGAFAGEDVVRRLVELLTDSDSALARQAEASLAAQPDRVLVQRLLKEAAASRDGVQRDRATTLLQRLSGG